MKFVFVLLFLSTTSAFAARTDVSQFFWQADEKQSYLTPSFQYQGGNQNLNKNSRNLDLDTLNVGLNYEYGWSNTLAIGASVGYAEHTQKNSNQVQSQQHTGLENIHLYLLGAYPLQNYALKYGVDLSISPAASEINTSGGYNEYTGRQAITPYIGAEYHFDAYFTGLRISYDIPLTDISREDDRASTTQKLSGATSLRSAAFFEKENSWGQLGAKLVYVRAYDTNNKTTGTTTQNPGDTSFTAYSTYYASPTTTMIGQLGYHRFDSTGTVGGGYYYLFSFAARLSF